MELLLPPGVKLEDDFVGDEPLPLAAIRSVNLRNPDTNTPSQVDNGGGLSDELRHGFDGTARVLDELLVP